MARWAHRCLGGGVHLLKLLELGRALAAVVLVDGHDLCSSTGTVRRGRQPTLAGLCDVHAPHPARAMPDCKHQDAVPTGLIDHSVAPNDQLADILLPKLWHHSPHAGEVLEPR